MALRQPRHGDRQCFISAVWNKPRSAFDPRDMAPGTDIGEAHYAVLVGPGETIRYPTGVSDQVDYEAELAVVIGTGGRGIRREDALRHVLGYTAVNDVTARDLQARHKQWFLGKSLDTFCPMGPWIATADELDPGAGVDVRCWVNGELRQHGNTRDFVFDIPTLIATISAGMTLLPGDVISTGTPAGVGPLRRGDWVEPSATCATSARRPPRHAAAQWCARARP